MIEPAPYPANDTPEQDALATFRYLINRGIVKDDIKGRDKHPNIDGTLELVDNDQVPIGKLDVQIRAIPTGKRSYNKCPSSLVKYSQTTTLPLIIVCVDSTERRAYWRHITPAMPEYKEGQKTFTIHFSEESDAINNEGIYIQKWAELIRDYKERIEQFPVLSAEIANKLKLKDISPDDKQLFLRYSDTINNLLYNDFISIKNILYPNIWKIGVGILYANEDKFVFQNCIVPYDEPGPLLYKLDKGFLLSAQPNPDAISETQIKREDFRDPEIIGKDYVLTDVKKIVESRALPIHGKLLASDVLTFFVDKYFRCLGIEPGLESYQMEDIDHAINHHLLGICAAIVNEFGFQNVDLDWVNHFLINNNIKPARLGGKGLYFSVRSQPIPMRPVLSSLRYLVANKISVITRPFPKRSQPLPPGGNWIWAGYTREEELNNTTRILNCAVEEYSSFVRGNKFQFPNSPYLTDNVAIIFEYEPIAQVDDFLGPVYSEHHVDNRERNLPKVSVVAKTNDESNIVVTDLPNIGFQGQTYYSYNSSRRNADLLFQKTPLLNIVYKMLSWDLLRHYSIRPLDKH